MRTDYMQFIFCILVLALASTESLAEPYLAVQKGMKCMMCHTNPTGGGKKNVYGNL